MSTIVLDRHVCLNTQRPRPLRSSLGTVIRHSPRQKTVEAVASHEGVEESKVEI